MKARIRKTAFRPRFSVGMNAQARELVERMRSKKLHLLSRANEQGSSFAKDLLDRIYDYSTSPEMRLCSIMQAMQTLAMAVPRNYIVNSRGEGFWILTQEGSRWVPGSESDEVFEIQIEERLPRSFFAKPRGVKNGSK